MGLRINTNVASLNAQRNLMNVSSGLSGNFSRLSSGMRIATASDDAAGLGISERMRSQIKSYGVAARNAQDGISLSQTAEGAMSESSNILVRMRELSMQSANGTLGTDDRAVLQTEFASLLGELDRISTDTEFNGIALLDGTTPTVGIQVGVGAGDTIDMTLTAVSSTDLSVNAETVATTAGADSALTAIDAALTTLNTARGQLGADQNRMQSSLRSILSVRENLSAAESRIRDVDVASETADLTRNSILQQAATSVLSQANAQPQLALSLLG
jgi:flagellin